jgi:hypothetical protein
VEKAAGGMENVATGGWPMERKDGAAGGGVGRTMTGRVWWRAPRRCGRAGAHRDGVDATMRQMERNKRRDSRADMIGGRASR